MQITLTKQNFNGVLEVADLLRVSAIVSACKEFLSSMLQADSTFNEGFAMYAPVSALTFT